MLSRRRVMWTTRSPPIWAKATSTVRERLHRRPIGTRFTNTRLPPDNSSTRRRREVLMAHRPPPKQQSHTPRSVCRRWITTVIPIRIGCRWVALAAISLLALTIVSTTLAVMILESLATRLVVHPSRVLYGLCKTRMAMVCPMILGMNWQARRLEKRRQSQIMPSPTIAQTSRCSP